MPRITISYRRDDSLDITGRIFDRLDGHFGREAVFRDIDSIPAGADFRRHIERVLDESDIILAIVGPRWIGPDNEQPRLASPDDPVRLEIETALRKEKPLIPVLVSRAVMPRTDVLPSSLHDFVYRHAMQVDSGQDFDVHVSRLIRAIERLVRIDQERTADEAVQGAPPIGPTPEEERYRRQHPRRPWFLPQTTAVRAVIVIATTLLVLAIAWLVSSWHPEGLRPANPVSPPARTPSPANSRTPSPANLGTVFYSRLNSHLVLDAPTPYSHKVQAGDQAQLFSQNPAEESDCKDRCIGSRNQWWFFETDGHIRSALAQGFVLTVHDSIVVPGTRVDLLPENKPATPNQLWSWDDKGRIVTALAKDLVLDIAGGAAVSGAKIIISRALDPPKDSQLWGTYDNEQ